MTTQPPGADPGQTRERTRTCAECGTPSTPGHSFCEGCGAVLSWSPAGPAAGQARSGTDAPAGPGPLPAAHEDDEPSTVPTPAVRGGGSGPQGAPDPSGPPTGPAPADRPAQGPEAPAAGLPAPDAAGPYGADPQSAAPQSAAPHATAPHTGGGSAPVPGQPAQGGAGPDPAAPRPGGAFPAPHAPGGQDDEAARAAAAAAATDRARALLVPVADPEARTPEASHVAPVLPGRPAASRPLVQGPAGAPDGDGGYACPWCATGNRPDRHYCRRCGMSMATRPEGPARLPWWRRLRAGNREVPWAGDRPRLRSQFGRVVSWVAGAAALGLVIYGVANAGTAVQAVSDHFAKRAPITPDGYTASRSYAGHNPQKAFDELNNTYWEPGVSQDGRGEWLQASFQDPVRLLDIIVTPGISIQASDLAHTARPHRVDAVITRSDGKIIERHLNLDQGSGPQRIDFRVGTVSSVRFVLRTAYGTSSKKQVAIAEVEFFGRSGSNS
ncbi:NADase-type glycan-binding domain-containing protein [Streptomyces sp. NBC_00388]|uniref:NADase-type glycan-binding domain-containing protein n=1 Tax=Streptomyces sp. NBC_00388 TaxID=2975735 RepID=UPI002E21FC8D